MEWLLTVHPYGARWRTTRRLMRRHLHPGELYRYRPVSMREVHAFLRRLATMNLNPDADELDLPYTAAGISSVCVDRTLR